jgi:hypothetical protein
VIASLEAFREGQATCAQHYEDWGDWADRLSIPFPQNPHPRDTPDFFCWNQGWNGYYPERWRDLDERERAMVAAQAARLEVAP